MAEIKKSEKQLDWACRVFITIDVFIILAGYISYFQTKRQLVSPLIPKDIINQILYDSEDAIMKGSLAAAILFLLGLWFYTFRRKTLALILLITAPICYKLFLL